MSFHVFQGDWLGPKESGTVVVREGHAGPWKVWNGEPLFNQAGIFFGRVVQMTTPTTAMIDLDPPVEPAEPETDEGG